MESARKPGRKPNAITLPLCSACTGCGGTLSGTFGLFSCFARIYQIDVNVKRFSRVVLDKSGSRPLIDALGGWSSRLLQTFGSAGAGRDVEVGILQAFGPAGARSDVEAGGSI